MKWSGKLNFIQEHETYNWQSLVVDKDLKGLCTKKDLKDFSDRRDINNMNNQFFFGGQKAKDSLTVHPSTTLSVRGKMVPGSQILYPKMIIQIIFTMTLATGRASFHSNFVYDTLIPQLL